MTETSEPKDDMTTESTSVVPETSVSSQSKNWALMTHLSALVMLFGIPSVLGPLVMWVLKKEEDPYVDFHGKEAVNFNLSFLLYAVAAGILIFVLVGILLLPVVLITWSVFVIIATVKAGADEYYRYPLTIRFVS